jgi:uncharacterized protein
MKVRFEEIPWEGLHLEITDESWFPESELSHTGPVVARMDLEKRDHRVLVEGVLQVALILDCDRCLKQYEQPLNLNFKVDLEVSEDPAVEESSAADHSSGESEMDVITLEAPEVDIASILKQQLFLALPAKNLCSPECKGLCPHCGTNLNEKSCDCSLREKSSPFAVLVELKKIEE